MTAPADPRPPEGADSVALLRSRADYAAEYGPPPLASFLRRVADMIEHERAAARRAAPDAGAVGREGPWCYDCGLPYADAGFQDLVVSHDVWAKITPTGHEGGLLCPTCMCRRAHAAGVEAPAVFRSGPFCVEG